MIPESSSFQFFQFFFEAYQFPFIIYIYNYILISYIVLSGIFVCHFVIGRTGIGRFVVDNSLLYKAFQSSNKFAIHIEGVIAKKLPAVACEHARVVLVCFCLAVASQNGFQVDAKVWHKISNAPQKRNYSLCTLFTMFANLQRKTINHTIRL